jgi:hypothetical protein
MSNIRLPDEALRDRAVASVLFVSGLALGLALMVGPGAGLHGLGPVCGHHGSLLAVHCAGCYAALAMMLSALALAARPVVQRSGGAIPTPAP